MSIWIDPPFNMLISGITNCGKTHYIFDILENHYINKFDYIIIYCPTFLINKTYDRKIMHNKNVLIIDMSITDLDELLEINMDFFLDIIHCLLLMIVQIYMNQK